jgi:hypothetical protein
MSYAKYLSFPTSWKDPVANLAALPATGNALGDARVTQDTATIWVWDGSSWIAPMAGSVAWGTIGGTLSNQTDLQNALDAKVSTVNDVPPTSGNVTVNELRTPDTGSPRVNVNSSGTTTIHSSNDTGIVLESALSGNVYLGDVNDASGGMKIRILSTNNKIQIGDADLGQNNTRIQLDDDAQTVDTVANGGSTLFSLQEIALGDTDGSGNSTKLSINDGVGEVNILAASLVNLLDPGLFAGLSVNTGLQEINILNSTIKQNGISGIFALKSPISTVADLTINSDNYNNRILQVSSASNRTITLAAGLPAGFTMRVIRMGTGTVTIAVAGGVTRNSKSGAFLITSQYGYVDINGTSLNGYVITGDV